MKSIYFIIMTAQDEFGNSRSSVEVIRLPSKPDRNNVPTPPPNLSDYAGELASAQSDTLLL